MATGIFTMVNIAIIAFFAVVGVYCLVLLIKLIQTAVKALEVYIRKNGG